MIARLGPPLAALLLAGPILFGLAWTVLPAFGYLPALGGSTFTIEPFRALADQPGIVRSAGLGLWSGLASALISTLIVLLFVAGWAGTRTFARVQHLVSPLLSVPHATAAFGLAFLIAPSGMILRLVSPELTGFDRPPDWLIVNDRLGLSLIAGLVAKEIPFLLLMTLAALPQIDLPRHRAVAASLGYGRIAGFVYCAWPQIYARIRLPVMAVVAFASSVVDVALILGPSLPATLAVRLAGWMNDPDLSMRYLASAGAILQLGVTVLAICIWLLMERIGARARDWMARLGKRFSRDRALRLVGLISMLAAAIAVAGGLATLVIWSFAGLWQFPDTLPRELTLRNWRNAAPRALFPLITTVIVAASASVIAVILTLLCLRREDATGRRGGQAALMLIYLPLIVPQVAFLFGLQYLFTRMGLTAGLPALVLSHLVFVMPYVFLSLAGPWRRFDRRYEAVAAGLGMSRLKSLARIKLPILLGPILTAAAVGFAVSIGQYLPTLLIGAGRLPTITTEAVALASGANRRLIGVFAFLQMLLPLVAFVIALIVPALIFRRLRAMRA